jgi:hypothetical protein
MLRVTLYLPEDSTLDIADAEQLSIVREGLQAKLGHIGTITVRKRANIPRPITVLEWAQDVD